MYAQCECSSLQRVDDFLWASIFFMLLFWSGATVESELQGDFFPRRFFNASAFRENFRRYVISPTGSSSTADLT
jgi:hypothetical protein